MKIIKKLKKFIQKFEIRVKNWPNNNSQKKFKNKLNKFMYIK